MCSTARATNTASSTWGVVMAEWGSHWHTVKKGSMAGTRYTKRGGESHKAALNRYKVAHGMKTVFTPGK